MKWREPKTRYVLGQWVHIDTGFGSGWGRVSQVIDESNVQGCYDGPLPLYKVYIQGNDAIVGILAGEHQITDSKISDIKQFSRVIERGGKAHYE